MIYDNPKEPQVVGSFNENPNLGFNQNLAKLTSYFEKTNMNIYENLNQILNFSNLLKDYNKILFEDCYTGSTPDDMSERLMLEQMIENSRENILYTENSAATIGGLNPIVGLSLPLLKRIWLRTIRRDIIPTVVAKKPVIRGSRETLFMEAPDGREFILPDSFYDGSFKELMAQIRIPIPRKNLTLPLDKENILPNDTVGAGAGVDSLSTDFYIDTVIMLKPGSTIDDVTDIENIGTDPTDHTITVSGLRVKVSPETKLFNHPVSAIDTATGEKISDYLMGEVDFEKGAIVAGSINQRIIAIKVTGYLSNENNLYTATSKWKMDYYTVTIGEGFHLNTPLTIQRVADSQVLHDIDETAKAVHTMGMTIEEIKDGDVIDFLDESRETIRDTKFFLQTKFNCLRPTNYAGLTSEYITIELKRTVDSFIGEMKTILNIENISFVIAGNPKDIRHLDDVVWNITPDTVAGGVKLNYSFGVMNRMHSTKVLSSSRFPEGSIKIYVHPHEGGEFEQLVYKSFEYSFNVIGNSVYRNPKLVTVPNIMVNTRYKNEQFTPMQGEILILNNKTSMSEIGTQQ